jgi:hypothetical protein
MEERAIKLEFVRRVLEEQARELDKRQTQRIERYLKFRTGYLLKQRQTEVSKGASDEGRLTLTVPIYARFQDMKKKTSSNRKKFQSKNRPIYNVPTMRVYNATAKKLMFFFTREVAEQIKKELSQQNS